MKKFTKTCLIVSGICILAGGGLMTMATAMGGRLSDGDFANYWWPEFDIFGKFDDLDEYMDQKTRNLPGTTNVSSICKEDVKKLDLEVRRGRVVILSDADSEEITVVSDSEIKGMKAYSKEDKLKVMLDFQSEDGTDATVYIHLPANQRFTEAKLKVKSLGKIKVWNKRTAVISADGLKSDRMEIDVEAGSIAMKGMEAETLKADVDVGTAAFQGNVSGNVNVECKVGTVKADLAGEKADYNYEVECEVGSIAIDGKSYSRLFGKMEISNGADKKMELGCKVGEIEVAFH